MSDIADELRAFEGSEALGNGDFSACYRGAAEITRLRAALATARLVPPLNPDRWRGAINDALTNWMDSILDDETPKDALRRLIQYEITAALDPAVSQSAADLVATAKTDELVRRLQHLGDWQAADRIDALQKRVAELEKALATAARVLHKAGEQFSEYAKQHAAKGTAVSDLKADFNKQWAERCFSAYWRAAEGGKDE